MKLTTAVRQTIADTEPPSINQLAAAIEKARTQLDYRENVRLLRRQFGDAGIDKALFIVRKRLIKV